MRSQCFKRVVVFHCKSQSSQSKKLFFQGQKNPDLKGFLFKYNIKFKGNNGTCKVEMTRNTNGSMNGQNWRISGK